MRVLRSLFNCSNRARHRRISYTTLLAIIVACQPSLNPAFAQQVLSSSVRVPQAKENGETAPSRKKLQTPVSVSLRSVRLADALERVAKQAGIRMGFSDEVSTMTKRVTLEIKGMTAEQAITAILGGTTLQYRVVDGDEVYVLPVSKSGNVQATGRVTGIVVDSAQEDRLSGVSVSVEGQKMTVITNARGEFTLPSVPASAQIITFKLLGYRSVRRAVDVTPDKPVTLRVVLTPTASVLSGVVTTATGMQRRLEVGNSVTVLNVEEIMKTAPITSVTDLLTTRVPGMADLRSTGAPGDPTRLRLRGTNSLLLNNDPIVIVDGIRMYAEQTGERNGNLISSAPPVRINETTLQANAPTIGRHSPDMSAGNRQAAIPATSPLDRLDPNSIETIEVLNGPSASAIYGSDAANGVIIITTKRGRAGPARWSFNGTYGTSRSSVTYPTGFIRWGTRSIDGTRGLCPLSYIGCDEQDSVTSFNTVTNPRYSPLGHGGIRSFSASVSGGTQTLQYALTGSTQDEDGILKLPQQAMEEYRFATGEAPATWMRRPQGATRQNGTASLTILPMESMTINYTSSVGRTNQTRSSLESALSKLQSMYVDSVNTNFRLLSYQSYADQLFWASSANGGFLPEVYQQVTSAASVQKQGLQTTWNTRSWLTLYGSVGWDEQHRNDQGYIPAGVSTDTLGQYQVGRGETSMGTIDGRVNMRLPSMRGMKMTPTVGFNYVTTSQSDVISSAWGLLPGTRSMNGARWSATSNQSSDNATFGVYIEPGMNFANMLFFSPAIRFDGGTSFGSNANVFALPKLSLSYIASNSSFFSLPSIVDLLKFRTAYGQSGKQPTALERLRLYQRQSGWLNGKSVDVTMLGSYGNTAIRPERSVELEGGMDIEMFDGRLGFTFTAFHKATRDALIDLELAPSVYGEQATQGNKVRLNLGRVRNTGTDLTAMVTPVRSALMTWTINANYSNIRNLLQRIDPAARRLLPNTAGEWGSSGARYVEGYPLAALWAKPMVSYADANGNGLIEREEVRIADSLAYVGPPYPKYNAAISQTLQLWNGRFSVSGTFSYKDGAAQYNSWLLEKRWFTPAMTDPRSPIAAQAAAVSMGLSDYAAAQVVSEFRFNSLSLSAMLPQRLTQALGMSMGTVSLQGSNLGLHSNYSGLDPNTNVMSTSETNGVADAGLAPVPRAWQLNFRFTR